LALFLSRWRLLGLIKINGRERERKKDKGSLKKNVLITEQIFQNLIIGKFRNVNGGVTISLVRNFPKFL